jgi:hypothetical protein
MPIARSKEMLGRSWSGLYCDRAINLMALPFWRSGSHSFTTFYVFNARGREHADAFYRERFLRTSIFLTPTVSRAEADCRSAVAWLVNIVLFVDQMLLSCILIYKISIAVTAMELTDVDCRT